MRNRKQEEDGKNYIEEIITECSLRYTLLGSCHKKG